MQNVNHPQLMLIINPTAGKNQARERAFAFINYFFQNGYHVTVFPTQEKGDGTRFVAEYAVKYQHVVCVGGDGTLNEVVSGLMQIPPETRPMLGYIPAGTTNDFASTLGIPSKMTDAMKQIVKGVPFPCDIGCFNGRYFTYVAAFGLFTEVSYETPQMLKNTLGHFAYILEGVKSLTTVRSYHMEIEADGEMIEDDFIYGQFSNSTSIGGMLSIEKAGVSLNDGLFEVLLIKMPTNPLELNEIIAALLQQKVKDCPFIYFRQAAHIRVRTKTPVAWTLDGEAGGTATEVRADIIPQALTLLLNRKEARQEIETEPPQPEQNEATQVLEAENKE